MDITYVTQGVQPCKKHHIQNTKGAKMDLHQKQTWYDYDRGDFLSLKLSAVQELIPKDVKTILDAGCGNGVITNALQNDYDIVGLDISEAALEHVTAPKIRGSITQLPFADGQFQLCMCHEVLEHLSPSDSKRAIKELKRCSSKYIMISVPYKENLRQHYAKCASCGCESHVYGHLQSYGQNTLNAMLEPDYFPLKTRIMGPKQKTNPHWISTFKQRRLGQWFYPDFCLTCPRCGADNFVYKSSILTKLTNALGNLISSRQPYWLLTLYQKK